MATKTFYDKDQKIWSGPPVDSIFHPDVSVGQIVLYMFGKNPNAVAQVYTRFSSISGENLWFIECTFCRHFSQCVDFNNAFNWKFVPLFQQLCHLLVSEQLYLICCLISFGSIDRLRFSE